MRNFKKYYQLYLFISRLENYLREGYSALANETLTNWREIKPNFENDDLSFSELTYNFEKNLGILSMGDLSHFYALGKYNINNLDSMRNMIQSFVPVEYKPGNFQESINIALAHVLSFYKIPNSESYFKKSKLNSVSHNAEVEFSYFAIGARLNGPIERHLILGFNQERVMKAVVGNVHELIHSLQSEQEMFYSLLTQMDRTVPNYFRFVQEVLSSPQIAKERIETIKNSHDLNFINRPNIKYLALKHGVNLNELEKELSDLIPKVDFLTSFLEGEAYIRQTQVISQTPLFGIEKELYRKMYTLFFQIDTIIAPFSPHKSKYYELGIGLYKYFSENRDGLLSLFEDKNFLSEVSDYVSS